MFNNNHVNYQKSGEGDTLTSHESVRVLSLRREFQRSNRSSEQPGKDGGQLSMIDGRYIVGSWGLTAPIPSGSDTGEKPPPFSRLSVSFSVADSTRDLAFSSSGNGLYMGSEGSGSQKFHHWLITCYHSSVLPGVLGSEEESWSLFWGRPGVTVEESGPTVRMTAASRPPQAPTSSSWFGFTSWLTPWFDIRQMEHTLLRNRA